MTMPAGSLNTTVAGEEMVLLADRAMFWPARRTLLVADPHFGKAAAFRFAGVFVPPGTTAAALSRLSRLVASTGATRIVFLGDFLHAAEGRNATMFSGVAAWRQSHAAIEMTLVRGNHDRRAGDPPAELGFEVADTIDDGPFRMAHDPFARRETGDGRQESGDGRRKTEDGRRKTEDGRRETEDGRRETEDGRYVIAGHIHPCVTMRGPALERLRLPCFWFGRETGVLPAFGEFTGCAEISPTDGDAVFVVAGGEILRV